MARSITLPFALDLTQPYTDLVWLEADATHETEPTGAFDGTPCAKFFPPTVEETTGLGGFSDIYGLNGVQTRVNVRWMMYFGPTYQQFSPPNKLVIINPMDISTLIGTERPMVITGQVVNEAGSGYISPVKFAPAACDGTVCAYNSGNSYAQAPNDNQYCDPVWTCYEFEADITSGVANLYIDGNLYSTTPITPRINETINEIPVIGGYWGNTGNTATAGPENYVKISHVAIDNQYIGPPGLTSMPLIIESPLSKKYESFQNFGNSIQSHTQGIHDKAVAGDITAQQIDRHIEIITNAKNNMGTLLTTNPDLPAYAAAQHPDFPGYNLTTEYTAMAAEVDATVAWIINNIPKDGNGYELTYTRTAQGVKVARTFSTLQTDGLRTQLQALLATFV